MIKAIFEKFRSSALAAQLEAVKESIKNEDLDLVEVKQIAEDLPVCQNEKELIEWIASQKINRSIRHIVIHCTATRTNATAAAILNYWRNTLKWKNPGYHILFHHEKGFTIMADLDRVCNGVAYHNSNSIHLSYIGGIDAAGKGIDNRSESQKRLMKLAVTELKKRLSTVIVQGHRDFPKVAKACPCFDAKKEF